MRPHFLIIGAQKAGTTNFWSILDHHPEIKMTPRKELHHFLKHVIYPADHEAYVKEFVDDGRITGEATPSYCFWPGAIERIHDFDPDMKLIMLLRNPAERAISQYWMEWHGRHEHLPASQALITIGKRLASKHSTTLQHALYHHSYLERGIYHSQLDRILEFFPMEQLHIQVLEDFIVAPIVVMGEVAEFLGVSPKWDFDPTYARRKGDYGVDFSVINKLSEFYEIPNKLLKEKYDVLTEIWEKG